MSYKVEQISEPVTLGEGPHWDEDRQLLYFVSINDKTIHTYNPATKKSTKTTLDGRVGFIIPVKGKPDQFLVGEEKKFLIIEWNGEDGAPATLVKELGQVQSADRINDGKADPRGRVFAGTMGAESLSGIEEHKGSLFRVDRDTITEVETDISISNGLAWDLKKKAFYYTDSHERKIRRYDYNVNTGEISNKTYIFDFDDHDIDGLPDGTTIDSDGNLWVAVFNGSCILHINPRTSEVIRKITIPALQTTSVTFGGPKYDVLFVTSASMKRGGVEQRPPCGATFMVTGLGVKGLRNVNFKYSPETEDQLGHTTWKCC